MKFITIPDARKGQVTKEMLVDLRTNGLMPGFLGAFASDQHWIEATGVAPPTDGMGAKYWRDNSAIWDASKDTFQYLVLERNPDGTFFRMPLNFSDHSFNFYGLNAAIFYKQYAKHFPVIPRIVVKTMSRFDAARLSFGAGPAEDYPLGALLGDPPANEQKGSIPGEFAFRFNPQTGVPEAFRITEYLKEYPFDYTPNEPLPPGTQKLSDEELIQAVSGVIAASGMPLKDKASAIRLIATR